jgi:hypothetical protein
MDVVTEVTISASSATIWKILLDTTQYPQWNPFVRELHGALEPGSTIAFRFALFNGVTVPARAQVLAANFRSELRWAGHLFAERFFRAEHFQVVEPLGANAECFRHGERFTGVAAMLLAPLIRLWAPGRYRAMNAALKLRAERSERKVS